MSDIRQSSSQNWLIGVEMRKLILILAVLISACANPGIVQVSPDTYMIARSDRGGIFGNPQAMKVDVVREANAFAASQGRIVIPISTHETPVYPGHLATIEYQFKLVDPDSPEAKSTALDPRPDYVLKTDENIKVDVVTNDKSEKPADMYAELMKLDDLRKRGILTDAEFEAEKKKLLDGM